MKEIPEMKSESGKKVILEILNSKEEIKDDKSKNNHE